MVMARHFGSAFLGHSTSVDQLASLKKGLGKLELKKILQIYTDEPNVNWKLVELLEEELEDNKKSLVNTGSCGLLVVNHAFQVGHQTTGWNVNSFLKQTIFNFLATEKFPLKFCTVR